MFYKGWPLPLKSHLYALKVPLNMHEEVLCSDQRVEVKAKSVLKTLTLKLFTFPEQDIAVTWPYTHRQETQFKD